MASVEHAVAVPSGVAERAKRAFFRSFFRLLVGFISVAEWASVAWMLAAAGVLVPIAVYALNRRIVVRRGRRGGRIRDALLRAYVAFAFTSIFCALFLLLAGTVALALRLVPGATGDTVRSAWYWITNAGFATV